MNTETALKALKVMSELRVCPFHLLEESELSQDVKSMIEELKKAGVINEKPPKMIYKCDVVCGDKNRKECRMNTHKLCLTAIYGVCGDKKGGMEDFWELWERYRKDHPEIYNELDPLFRKHGVYETRVTEIKEG